MINFDNIVYKTFCLQDSCKKITSLIYCICMSRVESNTSIDVFIYIFAFWSHISTKILEYTMYKIESWIRITILIYFLYSLKNLKEILRYLPHSGNHFHVKFHTLSIFHETKYHPYTWNYNCSILVVKGLYRLIFSFFKIYIH